MPGMRSSLTGVCLRGECYLGPSLDAADKRQKDKRNGAFHHYRE